MENKSEKKEKSGEGIYSAYFSYRIGAWWWNLLVHRLLEIYQD